MKIIKKIEPTLGYQDKVSLLMTHGSLEYKVNELIDQMNEFTQMANELDLKKSQKIICG